MGSLGGSGESQRASLRCTRHRWRTSSGSGEKKSPTHPTVPLSLILASSMAKVMWSWCSMPRATRLNATWGRRQAAPPSLESPPAPRPRRAARYLEEVLGDDAEALRVVGHALQVGVLVQDVVIDVQEELQRVLVQEVYLKGREAREQGPGRGAPRPACRTLTCLRDSMVK